MLSTMFKSYKFILNQSRSSSKLPGLSRINNLVSSTVPETKRRRKDLPPSEGIITEQKRSPISQGTNTLFGTKTNLVASVFASIKGEKREVITTPFTDEKVTKAQSVEELLSISEGTGISRKYALKVVSVLAEWTTAGKVQLSEFESDPRFLKLCRLLSKGNGAFRKNHNMNNLASRSEDLATVLSITADDEAVKMVENITLSQMVKIMTTLADKKRRSSQLLRTLAYNISANAEKLNIKQSADVLYSMSILNFYDENVLSKVAEDIIFVMQSPNDLKKSSVVGSIFTSLGFLKYKNIALLDSLTDWMVQKHSTCRSQDVFGMFMTLGLLNFIPSNFDKFLEVFSPNLTEAEAGKPSVWLEIVWSLVLLNKASSEHVQSVLNQSFVESLNSRNPVKTSAQLKLLNIDGAAQYLLKDYSGPRLSGNMSEVPIAQTREKSLMVKAVIEALKNLISEKYLKTRINTRLGFYIDAECLLDEKCVPQPLQTKDNPQLTRVAVLVYDYHDMCIGRAEPTGLNILKKRLLEAKGYKVVSVPHIEFNSQEKLILRVQYLESLLKKVVSQSS